MSNTCYAITKKKGKFANDISDMDRIVMFEGRRHLIFSHNLKNISPVDVTKYRRRGSKVKGKQDPSSSLPKLPPRAQYDCNLRLSNVANVAR